MGGFLSGLLTGQNKTLDSNINKFGSQAGFANNIGEQDTTAASKWYTDILSGDPTKQAEAIAPETAAAQGQAQQQKNQMAQFSPRSGGTAAASAGIDAGVRGDLEKLLGSLKSGAASGAASLGTNEQGLALQGEQLQDSASQTRMDNWKNSILGKGITGAASDLESFGLDKFTDFLGSAGGGGGN